MFPQKLHVLNQFIGFKGSEGTGARFWVFVHLPFDTACFSALSLTSFFPDIQPHMNAFLQAPENKASFFSPDHSI